MELFILRFSFIIGAETTTALNGPFVAPPGIVNTSNCSCYRVKTARNRDIQSSSCIYKKCISIEFRMNTKTNARVIFSRVSTYSFRDVPSSAYPCLSTSHQHILHKKSIITTTTFNAPRMSYHFFYYSNHLSIFFQISH